MLNEVLKHIARFIGLVLIQALVIDNIELGTMSTYMNPFLYILFILMLPFEIPAWLLLIIAMITGLTMDIFSNTQGMHASACVAMAFARSLILNMLQPREGYDFGSRPTMRSMGFSWFVVYASSLVVVHHLWLFAVEVFRFDEFHVTLLKTVLSASFSLILITLAQLLMSKPRQQA